MGGGTSSPWLILLLLPLVWGEIRPNDCASPKNSIIAENCLPGNDSTEWDVNADGDPSIQGFATKFSVVKGDIVEFKIKTDSSNYRLDIFRVGWYGGAGARQVARVDPLPSIQLPQEQPECVKDSETLHFDCGGWGVSAEWEVPQTAVSGDKTTANMEPTSDFPFQATFLGSCQNVPSHGLMLTELRDMGGWPML